MVTGLRQQFLRLALLSLLLAGSAVAQVPGTPTVQFPYTQPPTEGVGVHKMPAPNPHWVLIDAPLYGNLVVSQVYVVDGDAMKIVGMLTAGMISTAALSPDHSRMFVGDTFFSRGTRGSRTDVITVYDAKSLDPVSEIAIAPKR